MSDDTEEPDAEAAVAQSPDETLAAAICTKLSEDGLVSEGKEESVSAKVATGQMVAEDWRVMAAAAIKKERDEATGADTETAAEDGDSES